VDISREGIWKKFYKKFINSLLCVRNSGIIKNIVYQLFDKFSFNLNGKQDTLEDIYKNKGKCPRRILLLLLLLTVINITINNNSKIFM